MKYILLMNQGNGCDYTIACGKEYKLIEAENHDQAVEKAKEILDYFGCVAPDSETLLNCEIYELGDIVANKHDYSGWLAQKKLFLESEENKQKESEERNQLKNLLAKYGMDESDVKEEDPNVMAARVQAEAIIRRQQSFSKK